MKGKGLVRYCPSWSSGPRNSLLILSTVESAQSLRPLICQRQAEQISAVQVYTAQHRVALAVHFV
jgi:hypothetical protein